MEPLDDEIRRITFGARSVKRQIRAQIDRVIDPFADARAIFLDDKGELTPAAVKWFGALADRCFVDRTTYHDSDREMVRREAMRALALSLMKSVRLDTAKLARLRRALHERETDDE